MNGQHSMTQILMPRVTSKQKLFGKPSRIFHLDHCLELGCGTGKNSAWLVTKGAVTAVDFSEGMLAIAKEKSK